MPTPFQAVVDRDASPADAVVLAAGLRDWLLDQRVIAPELLENVPDGGLGHPPGRGYRAALVRDAGVVPAGGRNGVEIETGRQVVFPGRVETEVTCPVCAAAAAPDAWADAVQAWHEGADGALGCGACLATVPVTDWAFNPPWAFGHLSVTFWGWPRLSVRFLDDLAGRLGSRTVVVSGRR